MKIGNDKPVMQGARFTTHRIGLMFRHAVDLAFKNTRQQSEGEDHRENEKDSNAEKEALHGALSLIFVLCETV